MYNLVRKYKLLSVLIVGVILFAGELQATRQTKSEFVCPVCNTKFEAFILMSTNSLGGQDPDLLIRARGSQPVLTYPVTCPHCFYSGYGDNFGLEVEVAEHVREQIRDNKALKPIVAIAPDSKSFEIPAWVKYDLIAQTYQLLGKDEKALAHQFLSASWAVRVEEYPLSTLDETTMERVVEFVESNWVREAAAKAGNPSLYEIAVGREFAQKAKASDGEERMLAALAAIQFLRSHGENTAAQHILPTLKAVMSKEQYVKFERSLSQSFSRERHFQARAVALFEKVIEAEEDQQEKAILTYLCGELHRRLEHWNEARHFYERCIKIEGCPEWLDRYAKEQKELLPHD